MFFLLFLGLAESTAEAPEFMRKGQKGQEGEEFGGRKRRDALVGFEHGEAGLERPVETDEGPAEDLPEIEEGRGASHGVEVDQGRLAFGGEDEIAGGYIIVTETVFREDTLLGFKRAEKTAGKGSKGEMISDRRPEGGNRLTFFYKAQGLF